jgi:hypothetical protein
VTLFEPPPPDPSAKPRRAGRRPRRPDDPCCGDWIHWVALGRATDRHVRWLHHLAHRRTAFTEAWLAEKAEVPLATIVSVADQARDEGWIVAAAFGGVAGKAPEGRGRVWVGRLSTQNAVRGP